MNGWNHECQWILSTVFSTSIDAQHWQPVLSLIPNWLLMIHKKVILMTNYSQAWLSSQLTEELSSN